MPTQTECLMSSGLDATAAERTTCGQVIDRALPVVVGLVLTGLIAAAVFVPQVLSPPAGPTKPEAN